MPQQQRQLLWIGIVWFSVEAGVTFGWSQYADASVGIDRFGASAPGSTVMSKLGISAENVAEQARVLLNGRK